jgi:hypothetical protein
MKQTGIEVKLLGEDGNVFFIIGAVSRALKENGYAKEAKEYASQAMSCSSYEDVLILTDSVVQIR